MARSLTSVTMAGSVISASASSPGQRRPFLGLAEKAVVVPDFEPVIVWPDLMMRDSVFSLYLHPGLRSGFSRSAR